MIDEVTAGLIVGYNKDEEDKYLVLTEVDNPKEFNFSSYSIHGSYHTNRTHALQLQQYWEYKIGISSWVEEIRMREKIGNYCCSVKS